MPSFVHPGVLVTQPMLDQIRSNVEHGAEPTLIDKEGETVDASKIVATYRAMGSKDDAEDLGGSKDEL